MDCRPLRPALYFEELESRLLFSGDLAGVVETEVPEQDVDEEPVITADLESTAESDDTAALETGEEGAGSTGPELPADETETLAGDTGEPEETAEEPVVTADLESAAESDDTAAQETGEEGAGSTGPELPADKTETLAGDTGEPEETAEEPAVTADLESTAESADTTAQETGEEGAGSTGPELPAVSLAGPGDESENLAPVLTQPDGPFDYGSGEEPLLIAPAATVTDADSANFFQGTLTVSISAGGSNDDQLLIVEGGGVSIVGDGNIKVGQMMVGCYAGGTDGMALVISWHPLATPAYAEAVLQQIAYYNDGVELTGSRTIDYVLTDGEGGTSNTGQSLINLTGGDDPGDGESPPGENVAPVLTQPGGPFDYAGGDQPVFIAPGAAVVDVDSDDFRQGTLSVSFIQGGGSDDQLLIVEGGEVSLLNNNIKVEQKLVGSFVGGIDGSTLIISWHPQATPAYVEAVLRQIAYFNGSAEPAIGSRTVDFVLTDGDGGTSNTVQSIVNVTEGSVPPGEDPGEEEGEGEDEDDGDAGGGEVTPPADEPIDEPIDKPVDGQDDTPEPVDSGSGGQDSTKGGTEQGAAGDSETLTPAEPAAPEMNNDTAGGSADILPAAGIRQAEPDAPRELRGADTRFTTESRAAEEGPTFLAAAGRTGPECGAPAADGSAVADTADGSAIGLPEQPAAHAGRGDAAHEVTLSERLKTTVGRLLDFLAPSSATAAPVALSDAASGSSHGTPADNNEKVCRDVEVMRQEMEEAFLQSNKEGRLMVYTTTGASLSLAAGIARYFFHSGSLLSGFLATIPLWKGFDPVAILNTPKIEPKRAGATTPATDLETVDQKAETMFAAGGKA